MENVNMQNVLKILEKLSEQNVKSKHDIFKETEKISYATLCKYEKFLLKYNFIEIVKQDNKTKSWILTEKGKTLLSLFKQ